MAKFNFNLREPQSSKPTIIYLVIRYNNKRLVYSTKERILPRRWDSKKQQQIQISIPRGHTLKDLSEQEQQEYKSIEKFNLRLSEMKNRAIDIFDSFKNQNDLNEPPPKQLKQLLDIELQRLQSVNKDFFSYLKNYIEQQKNLMIAEGKEINRGSIYKSYNQLYTHLVDYANARKRRLDFEDIDLEFYHDFVDYLKNKKHHLANTIGKHIKSLKTVLNAATEDGYNTNMKYKSKRFKILTESVDSIALNKGELEILFNLDLSDNKRLEKVRDLFLVGCWTGMRFSDFTRIKPENIEGEFIQIETRKTRERVVIPIHWTVLKIMEKYKDKYPNRLPPAISNVKMNVYIKEICRKIPQFKKKTNISLTKKIEGQKVIISNAPKSELVSTHTARRSFCTNQYRLGVDILSIMAVSGHESERTFLKYIKVTPKEHALRMQKIWQKSYKLKLATY